MGKERYQFPLFDIVDVPFEVEGKNILLLEV